MQLGASETILLVNEDPQVRRLIREILARHGYVALEARDFDEAVRLCNENPVDLLVTDLVMPQHSGGELAERIAHLHPRMKILFTACTNGMDVRFLRKPFTPEALAQKVREILDAPEERPQHRVAASQGPGGRQCGAGPLLG